MNTKILVIAALATFLLASCKEPKYADALSPEASMATFDLHEDFMIELFAAEPHVWDPVEMVFDEKGQAYVVEMPDYPYKPEEGKGRGRIRLLKDTNGDGVVDESVIFAEGLPDATSMLPWKGGLIVTSAPHIYYLKDTNGDEQADVKEILFEGFFENNSEAQITNLRFGLDNWIYAANNGQPGEVSYLRKPEAGQLSMRGADFRFRLDTDEFELESGTAQFGHTLDDWNNKFFTQNTLHIQQAVIPRRYLERHGHLSSLNVNLNISDHDFEMFQLTPPPYWRAERTIRRNIQYQEQNLDRVEHADKYFTGASGGTVYNGDAFPESFRGNIFTGDVAGNLIHRDILVKSQTDPVFTAQRADEEKAREFLASTDPWFRPTSFTIGPDGYLYVLDFYRQHIETPVSIPDDLKEEMDFMYGEKHGRIYRIRPKNDTERRPIAVDLSKATTSQLIELLAHPSGWYRTNAQRLLLEKGAPENQTSLEAFVNSHESPQARLHAAYVLEAWGLLNSSHVKALLNHPHAEVKRHGLQLAERFPELNTVIQTLASHENATVSLQALLSLGNYTDKETLENLALHLAKRGENRWYRTAILSAAGVTENAFITALFDKSGFKNSQESWKEEVIRETAHILGSNGEKKALETFAQYLAQSGDTWQKAGLDGLSKGLKKHEETRPELKAFLDALAENSE
ncbi:Putative c-type cytochrome [Lunatimonas lonarensis]|uniref:Putative c-type cytochrome n=1 Tax=Lunatimonas lonarensis TaxID=1232681 RepID=R7ZV48_9BACT|nr:PVC-type heme-binding CxxCH protein [Lunatimonas lonarensis]EON77957.1 Putative c-type cytochrome [Lunatimonas lonarensis]